jgi:8-amino-7-oxononanoate synthase
MDSSLEPLYSFLEKQKDRNLFRTLRPFTSRRGAWIEVEGRWLLNASSNDYLGLASDPRLMEAGIKAMERYGFGAGASRLITGDSQLHEELESAIALWKGTESALLFNSGYQANIGVISALVGEGDLIYSDALNHASIIDGCRLSRAQVRIYRHLDLDHLESLLKEDRERKCRKLIVTETIFSMDGDEAPLLTIVELSNRYGVWLMVDEAHAGGVLGPKGRGLVADLGIPVEAITVSIGTLGKAVGSFGAYMAGSRLMREYLINRARSFIFTTALPIPVIAASLKGIELIQSMDDARKRLLDEAIKVRSVLREQGLAIPYGRSPIIPWILGDEATTLTASHLLREQGILGVPIRPPTVPQGTSRIRITLTSAFSSTDFQFLASTLANLHATVLGK